MESALVSHFTCHVCRVFAAKVGWSLKLAHMASQRANAVFSESELGTGPLGPFPVLVLKEI